MAVGIAGAGYALGSETVSSTDLALSHGLEPDWFVRRTGTQQRRVYAEGESLMTLAAEAIGKACAEAGVAPQAIGGETLLIFAQVSIPAYVAPSQAVLLAQRAGIGCAKTMSVDGSCAEVIPALETAVTMLETGRCERAIVVGGQDAVSLTNHQDLSLAGIFGAGAAAVVLARDENYGTRLDVRGSQWETHTADWQLGTLPVHERRRAEEGFEVRTGFYTMEGVEIVQAARRHVPGVVDSALARAGWTTADLDLVIAHQPNTRTLQLVMKACGISMDIVPNPCADIGNLGPANVLTTLAIARQEGTLKPGSRALLVSYGVGFSCGAMAVTF
ncbi:3-oxoacyl-ACP synthase III family protein [Streptacidiphilus albus]|uniref:3-oxoacyl-ACP synthase III family protein n=1 Tax=Streptacidiphilus albus TaxID=105425 RepID=UPI00054B72B3|nr:3-oxoacyl-[acyl-carrier-protein] synthase III C-terminal domain-containing protein [Streptacidiphilus albus]